MTGHLRDLTDYLLMAQQDLEREDSGSEELVSDVYLVMILFDIYGGKYNKNNQVYKRV